MDYPRPVAVSRTLKQGTARTRDLDVEVSPEDFSVALRVDERKHETATALESGRHLPDFVSTGALLALTYGGRFSES